MDKFISYIFIELFLLLNKEQRNVYNTLIIIEDRQAMIIKFKEDNHPSN